MPRSISLIIGTRDRAESLRQTLAAIAASRVPADLAVEVLVVDNGSADRTRTVVRQARIWGQAPRYVYEPRLGQSQAQNTALASAQGEVLLWTDDDVQPGPDWVEAVCRPILAGQADAVAGRIKLSAGLKRPWLRPWHRVCLAVDAPTSGEFHLTGANMAFSRRVLEKVPGFDVELGPGTPLGAAADTLFSRQLLRAGFRLLAAGEESTVVHDCGEHRLTRSGLADIIMRQGRSQAYIDYHWAHRGAWFSTFRGGKSLLGLCGLRLARGLRGDRETVIGRIEARWLWRWSYHRQLLAESQRPRRYERFGLALRQPSDPLAIAPDRRAA